VPPETGEWCHEAGRHPHADQGARADEPAEASCHGKADAAEDGRDEEARQHSLRTVAVQCSAQRQLQGGEAEEVGSSEEPEVARPSPNSALKTGASVAVTARNRADMK